MNKTFRVSGRLAVRLGELGVSVQAVLRRAGLPQDFFEQTRVLDEARHQMARYYLANSVLELTEAAYLLGYEDCSSSSPELPKSQKVRLVTDEEGQSTQSSDRG